MLRPDDHPELDKRHLSAADLEAQVARLNRGTVPLNILRPCHVEDGIVQLPSALFDAYRQAWSDVVNAGRVSKFIPASGAATRMFQSLLQYLHDPTHPWAYVKDLETSLEQFPFSLPLAQILQQQGFHLETLRNCQNFVPLLEALLGPSGLNYGSFPKALLPFHRYPGEIRTALEEHVHDGIRLLRDRQGCMRCHVTVSPEHYDPVHRHLAMIQEQWAASGFTVEFSISTQSSTTDTVALDSKGRLVRTETGALLFRPGGHGALLHNIQHSQGDIVLISNIDNVVPDHLKEPVLEWRRLLGGYFSILQSRLRSLLRSLFQASSAELVLRECETFLQQELGEPLPAFYDKWTSAGQTAFFQGYLNRPLRVCGMVQNTGDPGGGPFWVEDQSGATSKQIVEQAQIDSHSPAQQRLFSESTHFNPVDMVCGIRDFQGMSFDLSQFTDPETAFVAHKSYQGQPITVLEWPGLWNGGMAHWITVFVEIPRSMFNPVKTYRDWLHPHHQPPQPS